MRKGLFHKAGISIHAPREGGDTFDIQVDDITGISIHAPREGGDSRRVIFRPLSEIFQSTPPARGATVVVTACQQGIQISIHAPREGGDGGSVFHPLA